MNRQSIEPLTLQEEFRAFKVITSAGVAHDFTDPGGLALGKSELVYFFPRSDRSIHIPYAHIATIEETSTAKKR
ncbi:MAG TPA: hypothetical protein VHY37_06040 [Tepidisphaeraceae bacterium]|jgi:hypothetical protein|nr:hypothetical protein [Tepidisphaeraceae bacterium]